MQHWKLGVSSYSFSKLVKSGAMTQADTPAKAKEMGFDFIEFSEFIMPEGETKESHAYKLKKASEKADISVGNMSTAADFLKGSEGDLQAEIKKVKANVDIAAILGSPGMRHDASTGFPAGVTRRRSFEYALPRMVEGCLAVTEYAAKAGVKTMVENHGHFCQDSVNVEKLVDGVNHLNFGVLVDVGNFLCVDENPEFAVSRLAQYAFHVHVKDFHLRGGMLPPPGEGWFISRNGNYLRGAIVGHGEVPILQCFRLLKKAGYKGGISIEFEGLEEPEKGIKIGLDNLKRLVDMV